jgi:hypothetical protein
MTKAEILQTAKPILFSTPMVKALLNGTKTQTRRVIKPQPEFTPGIQMYGDKWVDARFAAPSVMHETLKSQPHYRPGDLLYVREMWNGITFGNEKQGTRVEYWYKAGDKFEDSADEKWRPSIHMPKQAARLFLRVTDVRTERLQEITNEGAKAEGMDDIPHCQHGYLANFILFWDELNVKRRYRWDLDPWVWVYTFTRLMLDN